MNLRILNLGIPLCTSIWIGLSSGERLFGPLWILPLVYIVTSLMILHAKRSFGSDTYVHTLLLGMLSLRFVLLPLMMHAAGTDFYDTIAPVRPNEYRAAVLFMAYEGIATGLLVLGISRLLTRSHRADQVSDGASIGSSRILWQFAAVLAGFILLLMPEVRERFSFVTAGISGTAREILAGYATGYDSLAAMSNFARMLAPAVVITWAVHGYRRSSSSFYPLLAIIVVVFLNLFYVVTSRASFFIPLAASGMALWLLIPKARQMTVLLLGGGLLLATVAVTIQKSFGDGTTATIGWAANYLSTYLMGPQEYAVGLRSVTTYSSIADLGTFFNDLFGNVIGLSALTDPVNRTTQFFNWTYLGRSSIVGGGFIVPASIQAAFYLGPIWAPLGLVPGLALAMLGQRVAQDSGRSASAVYLGCFALIVGVLFYANSVSTTLALLSFPLIPAMVIITVDSLRSRGLLERRNAVRA